MKNYSPASFILAVLAVRTGALKTASVTSFGPKNCVQLTRSAEGSCVIATDCQGVDTSKTEFAFDCVGEANHEGEIIRHSFGVGGFEANEEFDTEVKCGRCATVTKKHPKAHKKRLRKGKLAKKSMALAVPQKAMVQDGTPRALGVKASSSKHQVGQASKAVAKTHKHHKRLRSTAAAKPTEAPVLKPKPAEPKEEPAAQSSTASGAVPLAQSLLHRVLSYGSETPMADLMARSTHAANPRGEGVPDRTASVLGFHASKQGQSRRYVGEVVNYGPNQCVSVWKNLDGHCVMQTNCLVADISNYEFGFVCIDKHGMPVKHLFGKNSFDSTETFDTLIRCEQCLGLEDIPDTVNLAGEVAGMNKEIEEMKEAMVNISKNVNMLNNAVLQQRGTLNMAAAPKTPTSATQTQAVQQTVTQRPVKLKLRHSHKKHHHRQHHDEDEDEEDEDRYDDDDRDDEERRDDDGDDEREDIVAYEDGDAATGGDTPQTQPPAQAPVQQAQVQQAPPAPPVQQAAAPPPPQPQTQAGGGWQNMDMVGPGGTEQQFQNSPQAAQQPQPGPGIAAAAQQPQSQAQAMEMAMQAAVQQQQAEQQAKQQQQVQPQAQGQAPPPPQPKKNPDGWAEAEYSDGGHSGGSGGSGWKSMTPVSSLSLAGVSKDTNGVSDDGDDRDNDGWA